MAASAHHSTARCADRDAAWRLRSPCRPCASSNVSSASDSSSSTCGSSDFASLAAAAKARVLAGLAASLRSADGWEARASSAEEFAAATGRAVLGLGPAELAAVREKLLSDGVRRQEELASAEQLAAAVFERALSGKLMSATTYLKASARYSQNTAVAGVLSSASVSRVSASRARLYCALLRSPHVRALSLPARQSCSAPRRRPRQRPRRRQHTRSRLLSSPTPPSHRLSARIMPLPTFLNRVLLMLAVYNEVADADTCRDSQCNTNCASSGKYPDTGAVAKPGVCYYFCWQTGYFGNCPDADHRSDGYSYDDCCTRRSVGRSRRGQCAAAAAARARRRERRCGVDIAKKNTAT